MWIWKCHFTFSHVRICLIAYLSTVSFILSFGGQFRLWHKAALDNFEWQQETHFWINLSWISKNPVSKLHAACSCLPTWLVCDHFIPKDTKRTQEAEELASEVIAPGNSLGFHFLVLIAIFPCEEEFIAHTKTSRGEIRRVWIKRDGTFFSVIALFCDLGFYSRCKHKVYLL